MTRVLSSTRTAIGKFISLARTAAGLTQRELASRIGTTKQWLSDIERGVRVPSPVPLVQLHEVLVGDGPDADRSLIVWLATATVEKIDHDALPQGIANRLARARTTIESALLPAATKAALYGPPTLLEFPNAFGEIVVVIGDRREDPPRTGADLLAHSASAGDIRFLMQLGLDLSVDIVSDKLFALLDDDTLRRRFAQKTLLLIGSPAANIAARRLNADSLFRFALSPRAQKIETDLRAHLRALDAAGDRKLLYAASQMLREPQLILGKAIDPSLQVTPYGRASAPQIQKLAAAIQNILTGSMDPVMAGTRPREENLPALLDMYRKPGIADPIARQLHVEAVQENVDYGLISVGPNPFAPADGTGCCVFASGIHGPGTSQALRMLADARRSGRFDDHPLGGVIKVSLDPFKSWPNRFDEAVPEWQTPGYTMAILGECISVTGSVQNDFLGLSNPCRLLVERIIRTSSRAEDQGVERVFGRREPAAGGIHA